MNESFSEKVYAVTARIPAGRVATYGQIARMIGHPKAARQVGGAMSRAPKERGLPCHRVVNRRGELAPFHAFGDPAYQRSLLEGEGVGFLSDGRIDIKNFLWLPKE